MKRFFVLLVGAMMVSAVSAQVLEKDEAALVYYSPKTVVVVDFCYTVETQEKGLYAEFAEAMLGTNDAIMETKTTYTLKDAQIGTRTIADNARPHKVDATGGIPMLLSINEKGLLTGYNAPQAAAKQVPTKSHENKQGAKTHKPNKGVAPLPEEVLKAATPEAQAFEVAKQIFRIRETRMYLLSGEVEHAPADGTAMRLVLDELDKQEQALTELFIGKKSKKTEHKIVDYKHIDYGRNADEPQGKRGGYTYPLFFSDENGFTRAENVEADTILTKVNLKVDPFYKNSSEDAKTKKKKEAELSQIVYNLPGSAEVEVVFKGQRIASKTVPMAQLGIDVSLPKSLFTDKELPVIVFSEKTGNIISISK